MTVNAKEVATKGEEKVKNDDTMGKKLKTTFKWGNNVKSDKSTNILPVISKVEGFSRVDRSDPMDRELGHQLPEIGTMDLERLG